MMDDTFGMGWEWTAIVADEVCWWATRRWWMTQADSDGTRHPVGEEPLPGGMQMEHGRNWSDTTVAGRIGSDVGDPHSSRTVTAYPDPDERETDRLGSLVWFGLEWSLLSLTRPPTHTHHPLMRIMNWFGTWLARVGRALAGYLLLPPLVVLWFRESAVIIWRSWGHRICCFSGRE